jgi:hypothetical protein
MSQETQSRSGAEPEREAVVAEKSHAHAAGAGGERSDAELEAAKGGLLFFTPITVKIATAQPVVERPSGIQGESKDHRH